MSLIDLSASKDSLGYLDAERPNHLSPVYGLSTDMFARLALLIHAPMAGTPWLR